ncbi:MAG: hypothetical protein CM1200mP24_06210 [Gammaproteobacteria bacterium]|nr:MAG: hypothetical protein CM1200mP24_06210 [Gammaproteobacteria bacterium]
MKVRQDFDGAVPKIDDSPWPGFPPDLVSIATVWQRNVRVQR